MTLAEDLQNLQCPINWGFPDNATTMADTQKKILFKVKSYGEEQDSYSAFVQRICEWLVLAYLEYKSPDNDLNAMGNYLQKIEDELKEQTFKKEQHMLPIEYVTKGMKAFWHFKQNDEDKAKLCLSSIVSLDELDKKDQAAVYAIKAICLLEFAIFGCPNALESINKALELQPEDPEWNFQKGKCLARIRRSKGYSLPSIEELACLGKAVKSEDCCAFHLVFHAQSLLEYSDQNKAFKYKSEETRNYQTKCVELMRKAASKGENNGIVLTRVAKGLMHLRGHDIEDLVEHCVLRSLELLPESGFVNAVAGEWYLIRKRDVDKALPYLKFAAREYKIFSSYRYLIKILFQYKSDEELDQEIEGMWEKFKESEHECNKNKVSNLLAAYYFFVRYDIVKATTYWKEWLKGFPANDGDPHDMHKVFMYCPDMTSALVGEVNCVLNDCNSPLNSEEKDQVRSFLEIVMETRPRVDIGGTWTPRESTIRDIVYYCRDPETKQFLLKKCNVQGSEYGQNLQDYNNRYEGQITTFHTNRFNRNARSHVDRSDDRNDSRPDNRYDRNARSYDGGRSDDQNDSRQDYRYDRNARSYNVDRSNNHSQTNGSYHGVRYNNRHENRLERNGRSYNVDRSDGQNDSRWGQNDSRWGQNDSRWGQNDSRWGQNDSRYGQNDSRYGQNDSRYGRNDSRYGRNDSRYGQNDSRYGQNDSRYGQNDSRYGQNDSQYGSRHDSGRYASQ